MLEPCKPLTLMLTAPESASLRSLADEIASTYGSVENPAFLAEAAVLAGEMPRRVRSALYSFKLNEPAGAVLVVSGVPVDDGRLGRTPAHWKEGGHRERTLQEDILLFLLSSVLGECIAWSTQQEARLIHDILPIQGHEGEQLGSSSEHDLWWHNEDAFHPLRGDYLGMLCLRNPDRVATTVASLERIEVDPEDWRWLSQPVYTIRPDESHFLKHRTAATGLDGELEGAYREIEQMNEAPQKVAVLEGDPRSPYIRIDPFFMDPVEEPPEAQAALDRLIRRLDAELRDLVLEPGDVCFVDNYKAVHGRRAFKARYDGSDRWLKRANIVRDLRKSRASRPEAASRILY